MQLREAWESEAGDFKPWLSQPDNVTVLAEAIGLDPEVWAQERNVGPFRADVLEGAVADGLKLLTWRQDSFAYADSYDEAAERYPELRGGELVSVSESGTSGLLVRSDVAQKQLEADVSRPPSGTTATGGAGGGEKPAGGTGAEPGKAADKPVMWRFSGSVELDVTRVGRDAWRVAKEVIAHLSSLVGAEVTVTLEIEATVPSGVPEDKVRIVNENARTLKFQHQAFERE